MDARVRGKPVPARSRNDHWVERVRPGERLHLVILSQAVFGMEAHWNGARTIECTGEPERCPGCVKSLPIRWKGGAHVYDLSRKESYFVELTPRSVRLLLATLQPGDSLRGVKIDLFRSGPARNSRLVCELKGRAGEVKRLPYEQDPGPIMKWLWSK
jgi:hypothetical protein